MHTSCLERWTKSADRLHHGITRLVSPRHLDRPIHAERRWTGKLEGMGREGQRNCTRKSQRHNEKKGSTSSVPDGSIQSIFRHQSRRTKAFVQANMASKETSQAGSHRADHPDSCSCRQSSSAVGGERVLARRTPLRLLQRALWRARSSQDSGSRSKSFGYHWVDQQGGRSAEGGHEWNRRHGFCHCTQEAQEGEEQSRWTDSRSPAESSPGAEIKALDGGDATNVHSGAARGVVRVYGSTGTENRWSEHSGEISTDCEPEYHEEDLWIHVPGIASSAGVQVETDGLCQRLSREHGCAHVPEDRRAVQRVEPGVQRCAVGRTECVRSRMSCCCTTSDGRDGSGSPLACSDGKGMVSEQGTSETGCQDLGTCEPGTGTPARSPGDPDHLRHDSGMRGQTLRREVGSERLGFLARRNKMGERELCRRHLSHQRKKARSGGNDKRHHDRVGGCWTGDRRKQNT